MIITVWECEINQEPDEVIMSVQADYVITMAQIGKNIFGFFQSDLSGII